ncbi:MAG: hypothetical protein KAS32_27115, partial [Candidatus Peribacteraceae bacterium]|nr:hypothetical protein [Candidatus Peribacteraceae bacterium]
MNMLSPLGTEHVRGDNITIRFRLNDSCGRNITSVPDINISMVNTLTDDLFNCTTILEEGSGVYNCTFNNSVNPGVMPAGGYNLELTIYEQYYNYENTSVVYIGGSQSFYIETPPILSDPQVNASGGGGDVGSWSEGWNFTINVTDEDGDTVTATLWERQYTIGSGWGNWLEVGSSQCTGNCNNTLVSVYINGYTHYDGKQPTTENDTWSYKFNATDDANIPTSGGSQYSDEINGTNFTIERDDINITLYAGYDQNLDRNGSASVVLSVRAYDIDLDRYLTAGEAKANVWITKNGTDLEYVTQLNVDSGFFNYTFNPDCPYDVGVQYWIIGLVNYNDWFKETNSSTANITLYAPINGSINSPNGSTYYESAQIPIWFNATEEDCASNGVSAVTRVMYLNTTDGTNSYIITQGNIQDWDNGTYNHSWDSSGRVKKFYNITALLSKQYYYPKTLFRASAFGLSTAPELQSPTHTTPDGDGGWGERHRFTVNYKDEDFNNVTLYLWYKLNTSDPWMLLREIELEADQNFDPYYFDVEDFVCSNITPPGDDSQFKFNISDTYNFTDETSAVNFDIYKDDVEVVHITGFGIDVNREGSSTGLFTMEINDTDKDDELVGSGISGIFYVTSDGENFTTLYENDTGTDSRLYLNLDPNCTHEIGVQKFTGGTWNDTCYKDKNMTGVPRDFNVYGQLKNWIDSP